MSDFATNELEMSQEESKMYNQALYEKIASDDSGMQKEAEDAVTAYTRTRMREDGFFRKLVPQLPVTDAQLSRFPDTENPVVIVDLEPDQPAAVSIPFAKLPDNLYMRALRYPVYFDRIVTRRFQKDMIQLRTWIMDFRQVVTDNAIKDMLAEEDTKYMRAVNRCLVAQGATIYQSGVVQWQGIAGGITRDFLWESFKILPSTPSSLEVYNVLVNNLTIKDVCKLERPEQGGDLAEEIMRKGWTLQEYMGANWIITIKKILVPNSAFFFFSHPKFHGKNYSLDPVTMFVKREGYWLDFFGYEVVGGAIGNTSSVARADAT